MKAEKKLFAFKLSEARQASPASADGRWKARDGVAIAGCSLVDTFGNYRTQKRGQITGDDGPYC